MNLMYFRDDPKHKIEHFQEGADSKLLCVSKKLTLIEPTVHQTLASESRIIAL